MGCWRQWGAGGSLHALGPQPRGAESLCRPHSRSQLKVHWAWWDSSRAGAGGGLRGALPAMLARELEAGCARAVLWALPCSCGGGCVLARELEAGCARAVCSPRGAGAVSAALAVGPAAG